MGEGYSFLVSFIAPVLQLHFFNIITKKFYHICFKVFITFCVIMVL